MAADSQGRAIFISYRRDDSEGESGRLFDDLVRAYGDKSVFMDVAGIEPGIDFRKAIDDNVASCGVLLAVIGPTWATVTGHDGTRRLDNGNDYVRLEIGSALKRGIPVIPVLVHDARMPALEDLPDDLKDLRYRNSVELTHARWNSDVSLLVAALKNYVSTTSADRQEPVHANVPVQLPAPQPAPPDEPAGRSKAPLFIGIGLAAVVVLGIVGFIVMRNNNAAQPQPVNPTTVPASTAPASSASAASQPPSGSSTSPSSSSPASASAAVDQALLGKWKITQEPIGADDLDRVEVVDFEGKMMVQAWGRCANRFCDWGSKRASMHGNEAVTDSWDLRNTPQETKLQRSATLSLTSAADGLHVTVKNRYHGPDGQIKDSYNQIQFVKVP